MNDEQKKPEQGRRTRRIDYNESELEELLVALSQDVASGAGNTNTLTLVLPQRADPLVFSGTNFITLGRDDDYTQTYPTIDLTPDGAMKLGVSRIHAKIEYIENRYYIQDMGSSNGTFVGTTQVSGTMKMPINTGDIIRLGNLIILVG